MLYYMDQLFTGLNQRRNESLPRLLCVVQFYKMAPVLRTWGEFRGFFSSIFFETKRLSEHNTGEISSHNYISSTYYINLTKKIFKSSSEKPKRD